MIRVVWLGKRLYNKNYLQYFGQIRKIKGFKTLLWLKGNNVLYKNIVINFDLSNSCEGKFVHIEILSKVL